MKKVLFIFLSLTLIGVTGISEAKPTCYYWVVETNTCASTTSIIRIYNDKDQLVYTEHVNNVLDITNRKVNRSLNRKAKRIRALKSNWV